MDALASDAGISASHLSRLERSQTLPSFTVLAKIAEVLGVGIDEFVRLERDVTLLDKELVRYLDILGLESSTRQEIFDLSIEARRTLVSRLRQLSEASLTPPATQEMAARAFSERSGPDAWKALTRLIRQAGLGGAGFVRAWMRLIQTPGRRLLLIADRSFFLLPSDADLVRAYHSVFRDEALDPTSVSQWEASDLRDPAQVRRWPTRMLISRPFLADALGSGQIGPGFDTSGERARAVCGKMLRRLEQDEGFDLAITDADLGPLNAFFVEGQSGLLERLPERRSRDAAVRPGLWLNGPELTAAFVQSINALWDGLPMEDRNRQQVAGWLRAHSAG